MPPTHFFHMINSMTAKTWLRLIVSERASSIHKALFEQRDKGVALYSSIRLGLCRFLINYGAPICVKVTASVESAVRLYQTTKLGWA